MIHEQPYHWNHTKLFGANDSFYFAAALTGFNTETKNEEDPRYATLKFHRVAWGQNPNGTVYSSIEELKNYGCDTVLPNKTSPLHNRLYTMANKQSLLNYTELYRDKWKCLHPDDVFLQGDWNSFYGRTL